MNTLEKTKETTEQPQTSETFEIGLTRGDHESLPPFSTTLHRCDSCGGAAAALLLVKEENKTPLGFCGHHFRRFKSALDIDSLHALAVKEGEDDLKKIKGSRAGYLDT